MSMSQLRLRSGDRRLVNCLGQTRFPHDRPVPTVETPFEPQAQPNAKSEGSSRHAHHAVAARWLRGLGRSCSATRSRSTVPRQRCKKWGHQQRCGCHIARSEPETYWAHRRVPERPARTPASAPVRREVACGHPTSHRDSPLFPAVGAAEAANISVVVTMAGRQWTVLLANVDRRSGRIPTASASLAEQDWCQLIRCDLDKREPTPASRDAH